MRHLKSKLEQFHCCELKGGNLRDEVETMMGVEVEFDAKSLACGIPRGTSYKAGTWKQFKTLLWRSWIASIREPAALCVRLILIAVSKIIKLIIFHTELDFSGFPSYYSTILGLSSSPQLHWAPFSWGRPSL